MDGFNDAFNNSHNGSADEEADPAAEFLAREQSNLAGLVDETEALTLTTPIAVNGLDTKLGIILRIHKLQTTFSDYWILSCPVLRLF